MGKVLSLFFALGQSIILFANDSIVIGSKKFTESRIISEIAAQILEEKFSVPVSRKFGLGGTKVAFNALEVGDIDFYPEYTGTGYSMLLKKSGENDSRKIFNIIKKEFLEKHNMSWSAPIGFNNSYALGVRRDDPRFSQIETLSDIKNHPFIGIIKIGAPYEFMERKDGFKGLINHYNFHFLQENIFSMGAGLLFSAISNQQVDIIVTYSTDGRIKANDLRLIKDDLSYFPPYQASFLYREESFQKYPVLKKLFNLMSELIDDQEMILLNNQVDLEKIEIPLVAKRFLQKKNLLNKNDSSKALVNSKKNSFWHYFWSKRNYLWQLTLEHLNLCFLSLLFGIILSVPLGVLMTRRKWAKQIIFPIVSTLQTIPSLALIGFLIPFTGIGTKPAIISLFLYSLLPIINSTYTGINNIEKSHIESSKGMGLTDWQILRLIELPLALPLILSGVRTALIILIGTATLAALVGAGGLGDPIFRGVSTVDNRLILLGAIPSAILAILSDKILEIIEKLCISQGMK